MSDCFVMCNTARKVMDSTGLFRHLAFTAVCLSSGLNRSESGTSIVSTTSTVGQWLAGLGFADYESLFNNFGYDDLDFIVSTSCPHRYKSITSRTLL